jgi:hypothetical protein
VKKPVTGFLYLVPAQFAVTSPGPSTRLTGKPLLQDVGVKVGDVAQLGERLVRNEKVSGSIPLISTNILAKPKWSS